MCSPLVRGAGMRSWDVFVAKLKLMSSPSVHVPSSQCAQLKTWQGLSRLLCSDSLQYRIIRVLEHRDIDHLLALLRRLLHRTNKLRYRMDGSLMQTLGGKPCFDRPILECQLIFEALIGAEIENKPILSVLGVSQITWPIGNRIENDWGSQWKERRK